MPSFSLPAQQFRVAAAAFHAGSEGFPAHSSLLKSLTSKIVDAVKLDPQDGVVSINVTGVEMSLLKKGISEGGTHDEAIEEDTWDAIQGALSVASVGMPVNAHDR